MTNPSTQVATTDRRHPIVQLLEAPGARAKIEALLPPDTSFQRVMQEVYLAFADNPAIMDCEPASIVRAVAKAVSWNLVIGEGVFLIPRKQRRDDPAPKLRAEQGYKGKMDLILRARVARAIDAHCVYSKEHYKCTQGTNVSIEHHPIMDPSGRGTMVGAYAVAILGGYRYMVAEVSRDEIDQLRKKFSQKWKDQPLEELPWYAMKTAVNKLANLLPRSPQLAKALAEDESDRDEEIDISDMVEDIPIGSAKEQKILNAGPVPHPDDMAGEREPGDDEAQMVPF